MLQYYTLPSSCAQVQRTSKYTNSDWERGALLALSYNIKKLFAIIIIS